MEPWRAVDAHTMEAQNGAMEGRGRPHHGDMEAQNGAMEGPGRPRHGGMEAQNGAVVDVQTINRRFPSL